MYAVIESGGKQYRVQPGDIIQIEKIDGEKGSPVKFQQILMVGKPTGDSSQVWLGKPYLQGAVVEAEIVAQGRGEKVMIVKMKRRKQYRRTQGHRQNHTQLLVTGLSNGDSEKAALTAEDKKQKLSTFHSRLKAKGPAKTAKTLGSRKRMALAKAAASGKTPAKQA